MTMIKGLFDKSRLCDVIETLFTFLIPLGVRRRLFVVILSITQRGNSFRILKSIVDLREMVKGVLTLGRRVAVKASPCFF